MNWYLALCLHVIAGVMYSQAIIPLCPKTPELSFERKASSFTVGVVAWPIMMPLVLFRVFDCKKPETSE